MNPYAVIKRAKEIQKAPHLRLVYSVKDKQDVDPFQLQAGAKLRK